MTTNCGQCHGCAYKLGAAANKEGDNLLRGVFAALGGYPFFCHESLGWKGRRKHYPKDTNQTLAVLTSRGVLIKVGADPEKIKSQTDQLRRSMRACGGWKAAIRRLKESGWFSRPDVSFVRRHYAKHAAACIERLTRGPDPFGDKPRTNKMETEDIEEAIRWFFNEAKEAGIKIGWLFQ